MSILLGPRSLLAAGLLSAVLASPVWTLAAVDPRQGEYEVKAAFLLNFMKYVDWPDAGEGSGPLTVVLLGARGTDQIEQWLTGKTAHGRTVVVRRERRAADVTRAHVLFVAADAPATDGAIRAASGTPVLTISEVEDASITGAVINLFVRDGRLAFGVNLDAAAAGGLQVSSKLLALARAVRRDGREKN